MIESELIQTRGPEEIQDFFLVEGDIAFVLTNRRLYLVDFKDCDDAKLIYSDEIDSSLEHISMDYCDSTKTVMILSKTESKSDDASRIDSVVNLLGFSKSAPFRIL